MLLMFATLCCGWGVAVFASGGGARATKYAKYVNDKYAYSVQYPTFLNALGESDAGDGQSFESKSSPLHMRVWGTWSNWTGEESTIAQERAWRLKNLANDELVAPKVTYQPVGRDWFVLSGVSKDKTFYMRTVKSHGRFATVYLLYPSAQKALFDPVVAHVASSLQ